MARGSIAKEKLTEAACRKHLQLSLEEALSKKLREV